ncbi:hypothetical protein KSP40_PGU014450 [Platanthera guangdongensis]|uniref:Mitochondrial fission protein ELM1 n=1 Tax=Platanthera guangdongensis TaxID=2320717 RepID=A0ABR2MIH0_9ASPA
MSRLEKRRHPEEQSAKAASWPRSSELQITTQAASHRLRGEQASCDMTELYFREGLLLVVASGWDTISVSSSIKRLAPQNVFVIQVLTMGALHKADSAALRIAASEWHDELAPLPKPLIVVNVGGPTSSLHNVLPSCGSIRISFSRRTPQKVSDVIFRELGDDPKVYVWDGKGSNPHMGHLAWADAFIISADSVSMLSEACSTGKPVYVIGAERCTWKFSAFHRSLRERGLVRPFTGLEDVSKFWSYPPLNDAAEVASRVREALAERGWNLRR